MVSKLCGMLTIYELVAFIETFGCIHLNQRLLCQRKIKPPMLLITDNHNYRIMYSLLIHKYPLNQILFYDGNGAAFSNLVGNTFKIYFACKGTCKFAAIPFDFSYKSIFRTRWDYWLVLKRWTSASLSVDFQLPA